MEIAIMYGEDAQAIRKRCGLTQEALGKVWQKSRIQIGRYEKTRKPLDPMVASAYRGLAAEFSKNEQSSAGV